MWWFSNNRLNLKYIKLMQSRGRIQEFILGGAKPRSPIESWGRSPNRGREAPEYRGRSPSRGREAPENWGRSPNRGQSPRKSGGRGLGRGLGEPLPRKFLKNQTWKPFILVHIWGNYLKWLTKWFNCHFHEKSLVIIWCDGKSGGRGLGRGLGEPLPRKFLKNQTWNHSFWCIFEAIIWND